MYLYPPTIIIRHRLENLKKCSLRGLERRPDFRFFTYPCQNQNIPDFEGYILLTLDAPPLTIADAPYGLLILDATWRYAAKMLSFFQQLSHSFFYRSLPNQYRTAYPRRQLDCPHPDRGLASIEAIYLSYKILQRETKGLLDSYYWKEQFLDENKIIN